MIKIDEVTPELQRIKAELNRLFTMKIHVGIQGGRSYDENGGEVDTPADLLTIAGVHEYGMTIKAKRAKNLAIPISPKSKDKRPADFPDLQFFISEKGGKFLGRIKKGGKNRGEMEALFWLTPKVTIPERSFIRAGYDNGKSTIAVATEKALHAIIYDGWNARRAADYIGMHAVKVVKGYVGNGNFEPKHGPTLAAYPGKTKPLIRSGRLRNSITYRIEEG
jgi:hypothetical protein